MTIEKAQQAKALLTEKEHLECLLGIASNYDFKMKIHFSSMYNNNGSRPIDSWWEPSFGHAPVLKEVRRRLEEVNTEISNL